MAIEALFGDLPKGWTYATLGEVCERGGGGIQTGPFGSQLHKADYVPVGIPSIMPQNIGENRVVEDDIARITLDDARRLSRYLVRLGDIVYSRRGDVEKRALIREAEDGWLCGTGCLRVRLGERGPNPNYTSFYLGHPLVREWIVRHAHGATMPNLNTSILSACPFVLPPEAEQDGIASILNALDDKIDLNRRMNETLEQTARAIFKDWFVDFGPTRAKMAGQEAYLSEDLWALFPERLDEAGVPEGWRESSVGEIADVVDCLHSKKPNRSDEEGHQLLQLSNIRDDGLLDVSDAYWISGEDYQKWTSRMEALQGDCVVTNVGRVGAVAQIPPDFKAALGRNMTGIRCKRDSPYPTFLLEALLSDWMKGEIGRKTDAGTILNALNVRNIPKLRLILSKKPILALFEQHVRPLRQRMEHNLLESRQLSQTRDLLLPKLMSGELRVRDAKARVAEVL